jgi:hypothetical protein
VREYETKYEELERIYLQAMENFKKRGLWGSCRYDVDLILRSYLLNWGKMRRVLGYRGCDRIGRRLVEMKPKLDEFKEMTLSTIDMERMSDDVEDVYDEMLNAEWKSDKGRAKRVGPTATAKVLHMALPNLFMIWDRRIRNCYGFRDRGREYVRFLANMQNWNKELGTTIDALQKEYGKSCTKLIDEYNWKKCWG